MVKWRTFFRSFGDAKWVLFGTVFGWWKVNHPTVYIVKHRNASSKASTVSLLFTKPFVSAAMNENHVRHLHKSWPRLSFLFAKVSGEHTAECDCVSNGFHHPKRSAVLWSVP